MDFVHCFPKSSINDLQEDLKKFIFSLELHLGFELSASSAFRSQAYEISKGRNGASSHCLGLAVDISCYSSDLRFKILNFAFTYGVPRIGVYKNFIHIDFAPDTLKTQNIVWYG